MQRPLILHHNTALGTEPLEFIDIAAACRCEQVSLFTYSPESGLPKENAGFRFNTVTAQTRGELQARLAEHGLSVSGIEFYPITETADIRSYQASLALGRELGANRAVTLIFDADRGRALDRFGAFCELAQEQALTVGLEFTPLTRGCPSLDAARWFIEQAGQSHAGIGLDMLHLIRSGGSAADVARLEPRYVSYAQLCDGHGLHRSSDYFDEPRNRELPGEGDFPLQDILRALPAALALEVEVPSDKGRQAGVPAIQHAMEAVRHARAVLAAAVPGG
jgi:sugar phosphate isomerase/epimerase